MFCSLVLRKTHFAVIFAIIVKIAQIIKKTKDSSEKAPAMSKFEFEKDQLSYGKMRPVTLCGVCDHHTVPH